MADETFARLVVLACHDLRTPLATVGGFTKMIGRVDDLDERTAQFVELIDGATDQMRALLAQLALAARIESGRYEPVLATADTLDLVQSDDPRIRVTGSGTVVETDASAIRDALAALAVAAARHGGLGEVSWSVDGCSLELSPVTVSAGPVLTGEEPKDLGALVARIVIERLGGTLSLADETLRVTLASR
ncbi:MAG: histidine kinase dimerization/phospho-acceptor domain-containing protein [Actinomycetes bacterium]